MKEDMAEDRQTSLAFGSGWTALGYIDYNNKIITIIYICFIFSWQSFERGPTSHFRIIKIFYFEVGSHLESRHSERGVNSNRY